MRSIRLAMLALLASAIAVLGTVATATEQYSNFALSTLATSIGATDTSLTLASTTNFPGTTPFRLTIQDASVSTPEIVMVTAISGNSYTVTRGLEGTTATSHSAGAQVGQFVTAGVISAIATEAGSGMPGGTNGQLQFNNNGAQGGFTATGDCSITPSTGAVVCTKTNGNAFVASATTDTTNAANISSGTLPGARLPAPTTSVLGGILAQASATTHNVVSYINASGQQVLVQLGFSDLAGSLTAAQLPALTGDCATTAGSAATTCSKTGGVAFAASATTDTTNAANIGSGTLPAARLPNPGTSTLGGLLSLASPTAHQVVQYINSSGQQVLAQLGFSDLTGSVSAAQMPALTGDTHTSAGATTTTTDHMNGVSYPSGPSTNTVPVVTGTNQITYEAAPTAAGGTGATSLGPCLTNAGGQLNTSESPNDQVGTSYTIQAGDACKNISLSNASATALTLPPVTTTGFGIGYGIMLKNLGAGLVTITSTSNINASTTYLLYQGATVYIFTNQAGNAYETALDTPNYSMRPYGFGTTTPTQQVDVSGSNSTEVLLENPTAATSSAPQNSPILQLHGNNWNSSFGSVQLNAYLQADPYTFNATPEVGELSLFANIDNPTSKVAFAAGNGVFGTKAGLLVGAPMTQGAAAAYAVHSINDITLIQPTASTSSGAVPSYSLYLQGNMYNSSGAFNVGDFIQLNFTTNNVPAPLSRLGFFTESTDGTFAYTEQAALYNTGGLSVGNSVVTTQPSPGGILISGNLEGVVGAPIASATTIAPVNLIQHITGTTAIATITPPTGMSSTNGGCITLIADGAWTTTTAGNIEAIMTASATTPYRACYDGSKWFIK